MGFCEEGYTGLLATNVLEDGLTPNDIYPRSRLRHEYTRECRGSHWDSACAALGQLSQREVIGAGWCKFAEQRHQCRIGANGHGGQTLF